MIGNSDKKAAREATLIEVRAALTAGSGGGSTQDIVDKLDEMITELNATHNVTIDSESVAALSSAYDLANNAIETSLQDVANTLNDILSELIEKIEAGEDVGLTDEAITALATAVATLFHYPTDYPNAQAHTDAGATNVSLVAVNTHLSALEGYLDGLESLSSTSNTNTNTNTATIHTDLGHLTDGTQTTKITNGTQSADTLAGDSGQNALLIAHTGKIIASQTLTGTNQSAWYDVSNYSWMSITPTAAGSYTVQGANEQSNPFGVSLLAPNQLSASATGAGNASGQLAVLGMRYMRIVNLSGTSTFSIELKQGSPPVQPVYLINSSNIAIAGTVDTELPAAAALSDTVSNPTTPAIGAFNMMWNGATWERANSASVRTLSTLAGVPSVSANPRPLQNLNAITSPASGSQIDVGTVFSKWALQVTVTGTPVTCVVILEGSLDGSANYTTLTTWTLTPQVSGETIWVQDKLSRYVRTRLTTLTGGTAPAVSASVAGGVG